MREKGANSEGFRITGAPAANAAHILGATVPPGTFQGARMRVGPQGFRMPFKKASEGVCEKWSEEENKE
jgi:hypothetical protein